mgnify:FL=1
MKQLLGKLWRMVSSKLFWIIFAALLLLSPLWYYGLFRAYRAIDPMQFPHESKFVKELKPEMSEKAKGAALAHALTLRLQDEIGRAHV